MSTRIHTTTAAQLHIQVGTDAEIDRAFGYDGDVSDTAKRLILNDLGNQEAVVLTGTREEFRALGERLLRTVNDDGIWNALHWEEAAAAAGDPDANVEVWVVVFEPKGDQGGVGGFDWTPSRAEADALFDRHAEDSDTHTTRMYNAFPVAAWNREQVTDYIEDAFLANDPEGAPIRQVW